MRRAVVSSAAALVLVLGTGGIALAANPPGTGQPGASCEVPGAIAPPGFSSGGFANAGTHYAGSDGTPSLAHGSTHAVSQYDVACFQLSGH